MKGRMIPREQISRSMQAEMVDLFGRQFEGVDPQQFQADLDQKNWLILLEDDAERLMGFPSLLLYRTTQDGEPLTIVYSGDTIVAGRVATLSLVPYLQRFS